MINKSMNKYKISIYSSIGLVLTLISCNPCQDLESERQANLLLIDSLRSQVSSLKGDLETQRKLAAKTLEYVLNNRDSAMVITKEDIEYEVLD